MRSVAIALAAVLAAGCKDASQPRLAPPTSAPLALAITSTWARQAPNEPDPAAKALYRRGLDRLNDGDLPGAQALFRQVEEQHPESRFGLRLRAAASPVGVIAFGCLVMLVVFALR